jgi:hypothetical protein
MEFLGYVISRDGIRMDPHKVKSIIDWATPAFVWDFQCFLKFANFYRLFITYYSLIVPPFTQLTRKD